jgi:hypothetical protein
VESKLGPLGTSATEWPIVPAPGDYDDGEFGGMKIGRGNWSTRRKPAPAPLCPLQIPLDQTRVWNRAAAVGSQRLTAWAMARPYYCISIRLLWGSIATCFDPVVSSSGNHKLCDWIMHRTWDIVSVCLSRRREITFKTFRKTVTLHICQSILAKFRFQRQIIEWLIIINSGPLPSKSAWIALQ